MLLYADDLVLLAPSSSDLETALEEQERVAWLLLSMTCREQGGRLLPSMTCMGQGGQEVGMASVHGGQLPQD